MKDLTTGNETRQLISFALPMLFGNIFQQFYNMADSLIVGRFVGTEALAAVGTSFPVIFFMVALIMGIGMGGTVLIAQYYGAKDYQKVRAVVDTAYIFLFAAGIVMSVAGVVAARPILVLMRVPESILPQATSYLSIIFAGMITTFGYNGVAAILRGLGDSKTPLYLLIAATLLNVAMDLLFVVGFGWGIAGAAWATVIAQGLAFVGTMAVLQRHEGLARIDFRNMRWDGDIFRQMLRIGLPSGLQQTFVSLGMMTVSGIVNGFGPATMAAYAAAARIESLVTMPAMNLSQALMTFTGQNMGAGKTGRVRKGHLSAIMVNAGISLAMTLLIIVGGRWIIGMFSPDADVIRIGMRYFIIVAPAYILFGSMFINNGVMRGAGDVFIPMIATLLALWLVRIPFALLFTGPLRMGSDGIWWSIPAGWVVGLAFTSVYYRTGRWKLKAVVRGPAGDGTRGPMGGAPSGSTAR